MLEIKDLHKTYANGVKALIDINLSIQNGMFGLLGPNGAGKSTLMRTIATLQQANRGSIHYKGIDVSREPQKIRQLLGYLPQDFDVYPRISAYDLLDHLAVLKGIGEKRQRKETVESLLAQTNLWEARKKSVSNFSGGMKQRFGIAQALLGNPELLIVDEPTAGLDPEERNRFLNLLADIGENKVVLLSTHIVDDVQELCSELAIIAEGKIQLTGKPAELINSLRGKVWHDTVEKHQLEEIKKRFHVISTRLKAGKTLVHVVANEQPAEQFTQQEPDLEDVYFSTLMSSKMRARQAA